MNPRQKQHPTPARQHLHHDSLSHSLRTERRTHEARRVPVPLGQLSPRPTGTDAQRPHFGRRISRLQFHAEPLVEGERGRLGAGVVDHLWRCDVCGHRGDGDDHAVIAGDHRGKELSDEAEVGEGVDGERAGEGFVRSVQDRGGEADTCVVDQDCRVAVRGLDGFGRLGNGL